MKLPMILNQPGLHRGMGLQFFFFFGLALLYEVCIPWMHSKFAGRLARNWRFWIWKYNQTGMINSGISCFIIILRTGARFSPFCFLAILAFVCICKMTQEPRIFQFVIVPIESLCILPFRWDVPSLQAICTFWGVMDKEQTANEFPKKGGHTSSTQGLTWNTLKQRSTRTRFRFTRVEFANFSRLLVTG